MSLFNEDELIENVEEYFNEEDLSVGIYGIYTIDKELVNHFIEGFELTDNDIISFDISELIFLVNNTKYIVYGNPDYGDFWKVDRLDKYLERNLLND